MMKKFIFKITWRLAVILMFVVISCSDKKSNVEPHDPDKPVVLTSFEPDSGRIREMVLLYGNNFGADPAAIKVFFNASEAKVLGSNGTEILALVPRLPGDECILSVQIGKQTKAYDGIFRYKIAASVTTLAGNGNNGPVFNQGLDKAELRPVYMGADKEGNIFVTNIDNTFLRIYPNENLIQVLATQAHGANVRCMPFINPQTGVIQMGAEGANNRDRFLFLDPRDGYAPKPKFIKRWDANGYTLPSGGNETHHHCLLCEEDDMYYTRYVNGAIVRIDPETWEAKIIGMTPSGIAYGLAFRPGSTELWIGYEENSGDFRNSLCTVDVSDETVNETGMPLAGILSSFMRRSSSVVVGSHRDGPLDIAQFNCIRQIDFDEDGNLIVGDGGNNCIRMVNTKTMMVETIIGIPGVGGFKDGSKDEALFNGVHGIVTDHEGVIYAADYHNFRIRRIAVE